MLKLQLENRLRGEKNSRTSWRIALLAALCLMGCEAEEEHAYVGVSLIEQVEPAIERFIAGAHDTRGMYVALAASGTTGIQIVIPLIKTAAVDPRAIRRWRQIAVNAINRMTALGMPESVKVAA